jgi:hypothetical protein
MEKLFRDGEYRQLIAQCNELRKKGTSAQLDSLLSAAYIKGNYLKKAVLHSTLMWQMVPQLQDKKEMFLQYYQYLNENMVLRVAANVMYEFEELKINQEPWKKEFQKHEKKLAKIEQDNLLVFPVLWPIAYGDSIVINQFIKYHKELEPEKTIVVITPLNRPELKQLYSLNKAIDYIFDITLQDAESDRMKTLILKNGDYLNLSIQEILIDRITDNLLRTKQKVNVINYRYFPILPNLADFAIAGRRIWEERAKMYLHDKQYLPKLVEQKEKKQNKIVVHFRDGDYSDKLRNVNVRYAQDLCDALKKKYPDYEIVRLGDKSMPELIGVRNASHEDLDVKTQIKEIQQAKLFIGSHSAPQHLATACSDTPIICINYMVQETAKEKGDVGWYSYAPVGENVKKVFHVKLFDDKDNEILPKQGHPHARYEHQKISDVIAEAKKVL